MADPGGPGERDRGRRATFDKKTGEVHGSGAGAGGGNPGEDYDSDGQAGGGQLPTGSADRGHPPPASAKAQPDRATPTRNKGKRVPGVMDHVSGPPGMPAIVHERLKARYRCRDLAVVLVLHRGLADGSRR